jgi:hypothetical protein
MKVPILGANGQLARNTTHALLRDTDAKQRTAFGAELHGGLLKCASASSDS